MLHSINEQNKCTTSIFCQLLCVEFSILNAVFNVILYVKHVGLLNGSNIASISNFFLSIKCLCLFKNKEEERTGMVVTNPIAFPQNQTLLRIQADVLLPTNLS